MTETDVYRLEAEQYLQAMQAIGRAHLELQSEVTKTKEKHETLAQVMRDDLAKSFMTAQAQYELLKEAFRAAKEWVGEAVHEWEANAKAVLRLEVALQNSGAEVEKWGRKFEDQQKRMERLTGVDEAQTAALQTMLLTMGVGADEVERFTEAAVKLSLAIGVDATMAAKMMARAHAEGKEELKKFGIVLSDTATEAAGFEGVLSEIEQRTNGIVEKMPEYTRLTNQQNQAWGDAKKAVGGFFAEVYVFLNRDALKMNDLMDKIRTTMAGARTTELMEILKRAGAIPKETMEFSVGPIEDITKEVEAERKKQAAIEKEVERGMKALIKKKVEATRDAFKAVEAEDAQGREAEVNALRDHYKKMGDATKADNDAQADYEREINREGIRMAEEAEKEKTDLLKFAADQRKKVKEQEAQAEREYAQHIAAIQQDLANELKGYLQQTMGLIGSFIRESLLANTKFNEKMREYQIDREQATQKELGQWKSRAEIEKQLQQEAKNAQAARIADFLAGIAQQAGMKAIMEGIEAIASLASYDYGGAALHAAAAAGFGALAAATGAAAGAISSGRGMTTQERQQLEGAELEKRERNKREDKQMGEAATERGTTVNVYYLGLPGMTAPEMGRDLAKLQDAYDDLKTGGTS